MATVPELMAYAARLIDENQQEAAEFGAVYKFILDGGEGGVWRMNLKDAPGVSEGDGDADCTILMSTSDFVDAAEGRVDSRTLFFMGKLKVQGDYGLALKLKKLFKQMTAEPAG